MKTVFIVTAWLLLGSAQFCWAADSSYSHFYRQDNRLFLDVRHADLETVLHNIGAQTGVVMHYSVLPPFSLNATCVGKDVQELLSCLLGNRVNIVSRDVTKANASGGQKIKEIWLLGSSLHEANGDSCIRRSQNKVINDKSEQLGRANSSEPSLEQKIAFRKQLATSGNPQERGMALSYLAGQVLPGDREFRRILEDALNDDNPEVKGQAIAALVRWSGEELVLVELQDALMDSDARVRLMALQQISENTSLIENMLHDSDTAVRQLAAVKLKAN